MNKPQMRIRPRFLVALGCVCLIVIAISFSLPEPDGVKRARIAVTRVQTRGIVTGLKKRAEENGAMTNIDNALVWTIVFGTNRTYSRANSRGEVLDSWKTPYQIEIQAGTNFVVSSAGPDKKFGDADDIIFSSISNAFVNPQRK
jgi:hypothetical protein